MVSEGNTSSIQMIDAENTDLNSMLLDISSSLSHLETRERPTSRGPERHFIPNWSEETLVIINIVGTTGDSINLLLNHVPSMRKLEQPSLDPPRGDTTEINRLYISNKTSMSKYLIESGADTSVASLPAASKHCQLAPLQLLTKKRIALSTWSERLLTLNLGHQNMLR
ncbi:hypothetical protein NPIL_606591 [Nephila pilipes]|uniref:Uncharacterized protein n=1 Tax=Nephila pilipes TaxID=299642 RepID=A0A8X6NUK7_NEPPI|nr:hypothetical protein NPIL_606591 [Nephila pilipes]